MCGHWYGIQGHSATVRPLKSFPCPFPPEGYQFKRRKCPNCKGKGREYKLGEWWMCVPCGGSGNADRMEKIEDDAKLGIVTVPEGCKVMFIEPPLRYDPVEGEVTRR